MLILLNFKLIWLTKNIIDPYEAANSTCHYDEIKVVFKNSGYNVVASNNLTQLIEAVIK